MLPVYHIGRITRLWHAKNAQIQFANTHLQLFKYIWSMREYITQEKLSKVKAKINLIIPDRETQVASVQRYTKSVIKQILI